MINQEIEHGLTCARILYASLPDDFFAEKRNMDAELAIYEGYATYEMSKNMTYRKVALGEKWGERRTNAFFRLSTEIPESWRGKVFGCQLNLGGEIQLFKSNGEPELALTSTCVCVADYKKEIYIPAGKAVPGRYELIADVIATNLFDYGDGKSVPPGEVRNLTCGLYRPEVRALWFDIEVIMSMIGIARNSDRNHPVAVRGSYRHARICKALNEAYNAYANNPDNAALAREILRPVLSGSENENTMKVAAVGHAHLDVGWLWTVNESRRKAVRTFSSQIALINQYPDYVFGASQAVLYDFVKERQPELFEKIKKAVADKRWEIQGATWVEPDCNLSSGEALVRQFIHGKNYFMDNFGVDVRIFWLPDVFGYAASLPQIIRLSECDYFLSQKISWNKYTEFPHNSFVWRGIDGTSVESFFPPEKTYNANLLPHELNFGADDYAQNTVSNEFLSLFGIGDGGAGPKEDYIERGIRCKNIDGAPRVNFSRAIDFLDRHYAECGDKIPTWTDELYLEMHRGTYTSQACTKNLNRRCEQTLQATEIICSAFGMADYPAQELDKMWKNVLLNQFHDILPGSSIREVYETAEAEYHAILEKCRKLQLNAVKNSAANENCVTYVNTLGEEFNGFIELPANWNGAENTIVEKTADGKVKTFAKVAPFGTLNLKKADNAESCKVSNVSFPLTLENDFICCKFNADGNLVSAYDKKLAKEFISAPSNVISLYYDNPTEYDAWEIDEMYRDAKVADAAVVDNSVVLEQGPVAQTLTFKLVVGSSEITQKITLGNNSNILYFNNKVAWNEEHRMLRTAFNADIYSDEAIYEIPYGTIKRSSRSNLIQDRAQFEVPFHRYFMLADKRYSVSMLNDCKYGGFVRDGLMEIALLRSARYPDPECDKGEHEFTYAFMPSAVSETAEIRSAAASLNRTMSVFEGVDFKFELPFEILELENVTVEVVKKAEKSDALILRLVERDGNYGKCTLRLKKSAQVSECTLMEWHDLKDVALDDNNTFTLDFRAFEIKTIKIS